jgi:hypothetical protein
LTNKFIRNLVHLKTLGFMKMTNLPGGTWETTTAKSLALNKISSLEKEWRLNRIVKRNVVSIKLKLFCHFLILPYFDFQWCHISILPYFDFQWCHISILPYFDRLINIGQIWGVEGQVYAQNWVSNLGSGFRIKFKVRVTGHKGMCCNSCKWNSRYWMPKNKSDICTTFLNMKSQVIRP